MKKSTKDFIEFHLDWLPFLPFLYIILAISTAEKWLKKKLDIQLIV